MKKGLTLIELLIVFSLIAVLLLISTSFVISKQLQRGRDTKRKIDLQSYSLSFEEYFDTEECYPFSLPSCRGQLAAGSEVFIQSVSCDPKSQQQYVYVSDQTICPQSYQLYTNLENTEDLRIKEVGCAYGCGPDCAFNYGVASPNSALDKCIPTGSPTPTPIQYVCAPGGGQVGTCEPFDDPTLSQCPKVYPDDSTCNNECSDNANRCKNSSGKTKPE